MSNAFDSIIAAKARAHGVDPVLIKSVVAAESNFNPRAYRAEPQIKDASYGLMQTLYATARDMGYTGAAEGLYDAATSIEYGTRYLKKQLRRYNGKTDFAVAAYNSGTAYRKADGSFVNQPYVDRVKRWYARFREPAPSGDIDVPPSLGPLPMSRASVPIRLSASRNDSGEPLATVETFLTKENVPWVVAAVGGAMLLAALGGRRR